jgi:hypothetical protein
MKVFPLSELLKISVYLLDVEDKVSPGLFVGVRNNLKMLVDFKVILNKFKKQRVQFVALSYGPDTLRSVEEPYFRYYLWLNRLRTLKEIRPVS